jgi:hypothetical protein
MALLHLSISATEPELVANLLARILGGCAMPFPPFPDSWIAFSESDDGTAIEVYPTTHILRPGDTQIACFVGAPDAQPTFVHAAVATSMSGREVLDLGQQHGWLSRVCDRGPFSCIELWIENRLLIEVLDPEMLADYRRGMSAANWAAMFGLARGD